MTRSVLVTGGNRGIGLAIARAFVAQGDKVAVTHRSSGPPEGLFGVECDVTDTAAVDAAFTAVEAEHGPVEVLVSNAGMTEDTLLLRMSEDQFSRVLDTNLTAAYRVCKRAAGRMLRARSGRIVLVSSVVAMTGSAGQTNYAAAKAGLIGFGRSLARELGSRGVRANVVAPGYVSTRLTDVLPDELKEAMLANTPLGRLGDPEDIAGAVRFLASDAAAFITGEVLLVDGGLGM